MALVLLENEESVDVENADAEYGKSRRAGGVCACPTNAVVRPRIRLWSRVLVSRCMPFPLNLTNFDKFDTNYKESWCKR